MPISTTCPNCGALFRLGDDLAGKTVKCQGCASTFVVPAGDANVTQAGMLVSSGTPFEPEPPPEAKAVYPPPPPLPPPIVPEGAVEEKVLEEPKAPPQSETPAPRRRGQERGAVKSGSSALPWVLGLGALGLLVCLGCTGASVVWFVGVKDPPKKAGIAKKFNGFRDKKGGVAKFDDFKVDFDKDFPNVDDFKRVHGPNGVEVAFPPFPGFKDGKLPAPPPPGPPGSVSVIIGADGVFSQNNALTVLDPRRTDGKHKKIYMVRMDAGRVYQIDMMSVELDSYLFLFDDANAFAAKDDDSGVNQNARMFFSPPRDGIYRIEATSFRAGEIGNFTLTVKVRK